MKYARASDPAEICGRFHKVLFFLLNMISYFNISFWSEFYLSPYQIKKYGRLFRDFPDDITPLYPYLVFALLCFWIKFIALLTNYNRTVTRAASFMGASVLGTLLTKWAVGYFLNSEPSSVPVFVLFELCIVIWFIFACAISFSEKFSDYILHGTVNEYVMTYSKDVRLFLISMIPGFIIFLLELFQSVSSLIMGIISGKNVDVYMLALIFLYIFPPVFAILYPRRKKIG